MHVLIYALGGGWGHVQRSLALIQAFKTHYSFTILTDSPYGTLIDIFNPGESNHPVELKPQSDLNFTRSSVHIQWIEIKSKRDAAQVIWSQLSRGDGLLIVDALPRGKWGELEVILPHLNYWFKALVLRYLPPIYVEQYQVQPFCEYYDAVIVAGKAEAQPWQDHFQQTSSPWLIRSPQTLPDRVQSIRLLQVNERDPVVLVCASGQPQELAAYGYITQLLQTHLPWCQVRCVSATLPPQCSPELWLSYWPAIDLFLAADIIVSSGGYNSAYEAAALMKPLVTLPWKRVYDDQKERVLRLQQAGYPIYIAEDPVDVLAQVTHILQAAIWAGSSRIPTRYPLLFSNGVDAAADYLHHRIQTHVMTAFAQAAQDAVVSRPPF